MKQFKKIVSLVLVVLTMALAMVACGAEKPAADGAETTAAETGEKEGGYTIGFSMPYAGTPYYEGMMQAAKDRAAELGLTLTIALSNGDTATQLADIESFISNGVDAALVVPNDSAACSTAFADLKEAGIPVVVLDRLPDDLANVDVAIATDDVTVGELMVKAVSQGAQAYGIENPKLINVQGAMTDNCAARRDQGIQANAGKYGVEIINNVASEWDAEKCYSRLNDAIKACNGDFDAITVASDLFLPVIAAVLEANNITVNLAGSEKPIIIVGADGQPIACKYIREDYVYATINADAFVYGKSAIDWAVKLIEGEKPAEAFQPVDCPILTKAEVESAGDTIWGNVFPVE